MSSFYSLSLSLILLADRLENGEEALQDVNDDRHHPSLDNPLPNVLRAPDPDVNYALERKGPFEAVFPVVDFGVPENGDKSF